MALKQEEIEKKEQPDTFLNCICAAIPPLFVCGAYWLAWSCQYRGPRLASISGSLLDACYVVFIGVGIAALFRLRRPSVVGRAATASFLLGWWVIGGLLAYLVAVPPAAVQAGQAHVENGVLVPNPPKVHVASTPVPLVPTRLRSAPGSGPPAPPVDSGAD